MSNPSSSKEGKESTHEKVSLDLPSFLPSPPPFPLLLLRFALVPLLPPPLPTFDAEADHHHLSFTLLTRRTGPSFREGPSSRTQPSSSSSSLSSSLFSCPSHLAELLQRRPEPLLGFRGHLSRSSPLPPPRTHLYRSSSLVRESGAQSSGRRSLFRDRSPLVRERRVQEEG